MKKKLLLTLGTVLTTAAPIAAALSCGQTTSETPVDDRNIIFHDGTTGEVNLGKKQSLSFNLVTNYEGSRSAGVGSVNTSDLYDNTGFELITNPAARSIQMHLPEQRLDITGINDTIAEKAYLTIFPQTTLDVPLLKTEIFPGIDGPAQSSTGDGAFAPNTYVKTYTRIEDTSKSRTEYHGETDYFTVTGGNYYQHANGLWLTTEGTKAINNGLVKTYNANYKPKMLDEAKQLFGDHVTYGVN